MIDTLPILLDGKNTAFGGRIIDVSVNIEFSVASSFSLSIVNETGVYSISESSLRAGGEPMILEIGGVAGLNGVRTNQGKYKIFPVSYTIENSEGLRTLRVEFLDSSVKYLDKKFVLLKGTHITADNINNPSVDMSWIIPVGTPYEVYGDGPTEVFRAVVTVVDSQGYLLDGYGVFSSTTSTYYPLIELMDKLNTPKRIFSDLSRERLKEILRTLYDKESYGPSGIGFISGTRERDYVGTVREVLSSWGDEIGVVFYWDPDAEEIKFFEPNDIITEDDIAITVSEMGDCTCKSSSVTKSIQNNVLNGNVITAATDIQDNTKGGGARQGTSQFYLLDPFEAISLFSYDADVDNGRTPFGAEDLADAPFASGLNDLMKAASAGEDFYLGYVLHCLAQDYGNFGAYGYTRKSPPNEAVDRLYGGGLNVYAEGAADGTDGLEITAQSDVQAVLDGIRSSDGQYFAKNLPILVFSAENGIEPDDDAPADDLARMEHESLEKLLSNTSEERIFQSMKVLAENYNRWYFSRTLITNMKFGFRNYEKSATWAFHAMEVSSTPLAGLYAVGMKNRGEAVDPSTASTVSIPLKGEAGDWKRELPPWGGVREKNKFINPSDGDSIVATGLELEGNEVFALQGIRDGTNVAEFALAGLAGQSSDPDYTIGGKLKGVFGEAVYEYAVFQGSYSNLQTLRASYDIEENRDYGLILIDGYDGAKGLAASFDMSVSAPMVKEVPTSSNSILLNNASYQGKKFLYCRGKYDYDAMLTGMPDFIKPAASVAAATGIYGGTTSFAFTSNSSSGGDQSSDEYGLDFDLYAKGVFIPTGNSQTVKNNIDFQGLSFQELLSTAGTVPTEYFGLAGIRALAAKWAKTLSVNDPSAQYSQQITFVGIPEKIPSIAEGLEGLSISVDEGGVSTQISLGSRKIKREIFEKRQRTINEAKYRSERSRMTLIPNGRFSTRFLAGTQL